MSHRETKGFPGHRIPFLHSVSSWNDKSSSFFKVSSDNFSDRYEYFLSGANILCTLPPKHQSLMGATEGTGLRLTDRRAGQSCTHL